MADVWRPRTVRSQRRDRSLGTIDGRLIGGAKVPRRSLTVKPKDDSRNISFNSGGDVSSGELSPPYVVPADGTIVGLTLSVEDGGVRAYVYVNGSRKTSITYSGNSYKEKDDLDIDVDTGDTVQVMYSTTSGSPGNAVTTVSFLED